MSIEQEIRDTIERNKAIREEVGQMNCTLSKLEHKCEQYMKAADEAYQRGYEDGTKSVENWNNEEKKLRLDEAFDRGLTEAWELAQAIWHNKCGERSKLGCVSIQGVFAKYTAQEAIAKLKANDEQGDVFESRYETPERVQGLNIIDEQTIQALNRVAEEFAKTMAKIRVNLEALNG